MGSFLLKTSARIARLLPGPLRQGMYRLGPVTRLIRKALNRAAPAGHAEIAVAAGPLAGSRMVLDLQSEKDYWLGTYEPQLHQAMADFAGPGMTLYDIGANIGYITLLMARMTGETGRVFAFEALPENAARLDEHVRLNGFESTVTITHAAVIDANREVRFIRGASHATGRVIEPGADPQDRGDTITVPGISIDHFVIELGHPPPDLVKIDIEGGEALALSGMVRTLEMTCPVIFLELHGPDAAAAAWETLSRLQYRVHAMRTAYPRVENPGDLAQKAYLVCLPGENP
ncbi:MAG TPA: FkbM family methyltransferase [Anaerolineales bacterium]|nr:FkbM family methyltransferase [Anaerolineales bacterium]